jgi:hypothetical protein
VTPQAHFQGDSCEPCQPPGPPAGSNFVDHAAYLAEVVLLGNIAIRTKEKLLWDAEKMRITNHEPANAYLNPPYRQGWTL